MEVRMRDKQYIFSCINGEPEDLQYLYQLFNINDIDSKIQGLKIESDQMGLEEVVIVLITSAIIPSLIEAIKIWIENRGKKISIEDKKTGKKIVFDSKNGKALSDFDMEKLLSFFKDEEEE